MKPLSVQIETVGKLPGGCKTMHFVGEGCWVRGHQMLNRVAAVAVVLSMRDSFQA